MPSSGMLRSVEWQFVTVVSGQPTGLTSKDQEVQEEDGTNWLSCNPFTELLLLNIVLNIEF
jgi:hypothetical protein